jgi:hypothetical protein
VKDEYPSSSVATQQNSKFTNAVVDTVKIKLPFSDIETSSDDSDTRQHESNQEVEGIISTRETRVRKGPAWLQDFVTTDNKRGKQKIDAKKLL